MSYKPTIGLEIHAELKTKSKMFCDCRNEPHAKEANIHICPVCLAHPGTLPRVNEEAVNYVLKIGKAVSGKLATYSEFDRKNYFYPDIPKAYQISQYAYPFVSGGNYAGVELTRIHLEEDTARSQHSGEHSIVDFNRAGVPLMELVTEPIIHDAKTAVQFAKELQLLLRTLDISDANMELGEMRVEANISVSETDTLGTKVEVKNLNSFKAVEQAIEYEINRQINEPNIVSETRGWDEQKSRTFSQRSKETAEDYRYFPDPDIPKYNINNSRVSEIKVKLPQEIRAELESWSIRDNQIENFLYEPELRNFFYATVKHLANKEAKKLAANYLTSDVLGLLESNTLDSNNAPMFAKLITMASEGTINSRIAKDLLTETVFDGLDPEKLATERNLLQSNDTEALLPLVKEIIANNPTVVSDYQAGKESAIQYLVGQGMKETKGSANPSTLRELFEGEMGK